MNKLNCNRLTFSIVTPTLNSEIFLSQTIESVINQTGNFAIEYIIVDGGSTDTTLSLLERYNNKLKKFPNISFYYISEKDNGMYDAINKGFSRCSGDIYGYINSDDIYLPGVFAQIAMVFLTYSNVYWLKGITSYIDEKSFIYAEGKCYLYNRRWLRQGIYGNYLYFVQQDSVFWRAELWKKAGQISSNLEFAGDYDLWLKFSKFAKLVSLNVFVSCFRRRPNQLSSHIDKYKAEMKTICKPNRIIKWKIRTYRSLRKKINWGKIISKILFIIILGFHFYEVIHIDKNNGKIMRKVLFYNENI